MCQFLTACTVCVLVVHNLTPTNFMVGFTITTARDVALSTLDYVLLLQDSSFSSVDVVIIESPCHNTCYKIFCCRLKKAIRMGREISPEGLSTKKVMFASGLAF